jgi:single-strand DNA-binding protein
MMVAVRGRIHYSKWTDREGVERYGCEIIAEDVQFLSRSKQAGGGEASGQNDIDDDLPF